MRPGPDSRRHPLPICAGSLSFDPDTGAVSLRGCNVSLGRRERQVLRVLLQSRGAVVSGPELQRQAWGEAHDGGVARLRSSIYRLRQRLHNSRLIETIGSEGYRVSFCDGAAAKATWPDKQHQPDQRTA